MSAYASIPTAEPVPTEATLLEAKVVAGEDTRVRILQVNEKRARLFRSPSAP